MANIVQDANGLVPIMNSASSAQMCPEEECLLTTDAKLGVGDPVKKTGSASADGKWQTVTRAAAGDAIYGVYMGLAHPTILTTPGYYNGSDTGVYGLIQRERPGQEYEIMEDGDGGTLAYSDVGKVADIIVTDASATTGRSTVKLDSSTAASGSSAQLRIKRLSRRVNSATGSYAIWVVEINESQNANAANGV